MQNLQRNRFSIKTLLMVTAAGVVLSGTIGGTVAWLVAKTNTVTNTFTYGDIDITLEETPVGDGDGDDGDDTTNTYEMVPGNTITKDPIITVEGGSEKAWLFVKLEESANFNQFMTYDLVDAWQPLDDVTGVYYQVVDKIDADTDYPVLEQNQVTVKDTVTKEQFNALTEATYPQLKVSAYAVQYTAADAAADAWDLANE